MAQYTCRRVTRRGGSTYGLPRLRLDGALPQAPATPVMSVNDHENAALFTGSSDAQERSRAFAGSR